MIHRASTTRKLLITLADPLGHRRARARRRLLLWGGSAAAGSVLALVLGAAGRKKRRQGTIGQEPQGTPRTAVVKDPAGGLRSRHGEGAGPGAGAALGPIPLRGTTPLDDAAARARKVAPSAAGEEPGRSAHLGFGVGGSIPAPALTDDDAEAVPTGGGDALGGSLRGEERPTADAGLVTGAGEAIGNSTTPSHDGNSVH